MHMGFFSMVFLLLLSGQGGVIQAPPRDLLSLVNVQAALETRHVATDEAGLLKLFEAPSTAPAAAALEKALADLASPDAEVRRKAAGVLRAAQAAADPYIDQALRSINPQVRAAGEELKVIAEMRVAATAQQTTDDFLIRLLAVRRLEEIKSQNALPMLETLAKGDDICMADAAAQAVAVIKGQPLPRPEAARALQSLGAALPDNIGFLGVAELVAGATALPLSQRTQGIVVELEKAGLGQMMGEMGRMAPRMDQGIAGFIAKAGNVRVDAAAVVFPKDFEVAPHARYILWVLSGRYDPARMTAALRPRMPMDRTAIERKILCSAGNNRAACCYDANTLILAYGRGSADAIAALVTRMDTQKLPPPAEFAQVMKTFADKGPRFAATGVLSDAQKAEMQKDLGREVERMGQRPPRPETTMFQAMIRMALKLPDVRQFDAWVSADGPITITARCADADAATALAQPLTEWEQALRALPETMAREHAGELPKGLMDLFTASLHEGALWKSRADADTVVTESHQRSLGMLFLMVMGGVRTSHVQAMPVAPLQPVAPAPHPF